QPLFRTHPAAGKSQRADIPRAVNARPMTDVRPEGEGAEDKVFRSHAGAPIDLGPAPHERLPVFSGIEPSERAPRGSGCLVQITVSGERVSEQSAVRRMFELFSRQLAFGREGQPA